MATILSIVWYKVLPPKFGGQKGIAFFNKYLSKDHSLICLCSRNNEQADDLSYCILPELPVSKSQFLNPFCWKKIRRIARKEKVTHIILEHPYHAIAAYLAKKATGAKLIIHSHNIESERFRQEKKRGWKILARLEKWIHQQADLSLFKTSTGQQYAIDHWGLFPGKCMIIPYGIEPTPHMDKVRVSKLIHQRHNIDNGKKIFLFAGTLDYGPNARAVEAIYKEIAPRLDKLIRNGYTILICGRNKFPSFQYLKELDHPAIIYAGEVDDMENYFAAADTFINPVTEGGGIQTKNLDALAQHCNVVAFDQMSGDEIRNLSAGKLFTANLYDWDDFARQVIKSGSVKELTPGTFFDHYNWQTILANLSEYIGKR